MLSDSLNTNEIKDSAGLEVEFQRLKNEGRTALFAKIGEQPALPYRLTIKHQETGAGLKKRLRSVVRFDKTSMSTVDATVPIVSSAYLVLDNPIGGILANTEAANVLANLLSFCSTTGAATTVLFDGTGNGAKTVLNGSL